MKKSLLLFSLSVTLSFSTKAQTSVYHPFPDSDAVWRGIRVSGACCSSYDYQQYINGDTIIAGKTYHKIYEVGYFQLDTFPRQFYNKGVIGTYRQDSSKQILYYNSYYQKEEILYDFNVTDTVGSPVICDSVPCPSLSVTSIDSVFDGINYRKKYNIVYVSLIEGIGSTLGLFDGFYLPFEGGSSIECFIQNGMVRYHTSNSNYCNLITDVDQTSEKNISITLSPNPFHSTATLEIRNGELGIKNAELRIYDLMGRLVQQQIINNQSTIINRGGLSDGLYFYQIRTTDCELIATGKFVVE